MSAGCGVVWGLGVSLCIEQVVCFGFFTDKFTFNKLLPRYKVKEVPYQSLHRNDKNNCNEVRGEGVPEVE